MADLDGLSKDQQEAWTIFGIYTGFDWTSDDKDIIIWAKGKIMKINIAQKLHRKFRLKLMPDTN